MWKIGLLLLVFAGVSWAENSLDYQRSLWYPTYHGERLAYCDKSEQKCGRVIANAYCQTLGYASVKKYRIEPNVGRVHYFDNEGECTGWQCHGFLFIDCVGYFQKKPHDYHYRLKEFVFPRIENHRVDWCYRDKKQCGERAAYSFCRKMGYSNVSDFERDNHTEATKTLGDHVLCYGKQCSGFKRVTCKR